MEASNWRFILLSGYVLLCPKHLPAAITLHGIVVDKDTRAGVPNAIVNAVGNRAKQADVTDLYGLFTLPLRDEVQADEEITLRVEKDGYEVSQQKESATASAQIKLLIAPLPKKPLVPATGPAVPSAPKRNAANPKPPVPPVLKPATPPTLLPDAPPEVSHFVIELQSEDAMARENAAIALGKMGDVAAASVPYLIQALKDKVSQVQIRAANALERIRPNSKQAVVGLIIALNDTRTPDLRIAAATALGAIGQPAQAAVPHLLSALGDEKPLVRLAAAEASLSIESQPRPEIAQALCGLLVQPDPIPAKTAFVLSRLGPAAAPCGLELAELLKDAKKRELVYNVVKEMGPPGLAVLYSAMSKQYLPLDSLTEVVRLFPGSTAAVANALFSSLERCSSFGCDEIAKILLEIQPDRVNEVAHQLLRRPDQYGDNLRYLVKIGPPAAPAIEEVVSGAHGRQILNWSGTLLAVDPSAKSRLAQLLAKPLESGSPDDQTYAAVALVRAGVPTDRTSQVLLDSVLSTARDSEARDAAAEVLDLIALPQSATSALTRLLFNQEETADVRFKAVRALAKQGADSQEAIRQLFRCRQFCGYADWLYKALDAAFINLGSAALPIIDEKLRGSDVPARQLAADLVVDLRCDRHSLVGSLASGLKDSRVAERYSRAIASIGPDAKAAIPELIVMLQSGGNATEPAAKALGAIGPNAGAAVPPLLKALRSDKQHRSGLAEALGNIGAPAQSALPDLQYYSESKERYGSVARSASEAILKIQAALAK